jgi:hypothetical protein
MSLEWAAVTRESAKIVPEFVTFGQQDPGPRPRQDYNGDG